MDEVENEEIGIISRISVGLQGSDFNPGPTENPFLNGLQQYIAQSHEQDRH